GGAAPVMTTRLGAFPDMEVAAMKRFTDSILFLALFVLAALAWLVLANTGGVPDAAPGRIAPMTVGAVVVIACPALVVAAVLGLIRALVHTPPRRFYSWAAGAAVVSSAFVALASVPAQRQGVEVGFEWMAWYFGIQALSFVIALVIALTGGIPGPEELAAEKEAAAARRSSPASTGGPASTTTQPKKAPVVPAGSTPSAGLPSARETDPLTPDPTGGTPRTGLDDATGPTRGAGQPVTRPADGAHTQVSGTPGSTAIPDSGEPRA
ncbi:MAG: hypothetical protein L0L69_11700, partial [Propionibacterium sp.]|nr:hypothetical protein [Propionibacterium sp.]